MENILVRHETLEFDMTQKKREITASSKKQDTGEAPGILLQEYNSLVSLYTHSENTLFSLFNFYVTLLTTITGAIIVAFQIGEKYASNLFFTIFILLVFVVLIGIITQDALIHKNGDLAHYALALNAIKSHLLEKHPEAHAHVFYMWNPHIRVHPLQYQESLDERLDRHLWWMLPIGMQQLFASVMDSFALAGMIIEMAGEEEWTSAKVGADNMKILPTRLFGAIAGDMIGFRFEWNK
jgi:hypothetical protein